MNNFLPTQSNPIHKSNSTPKSKSSQASSQNVLEIFNVLVDSTREKKNPKDGDEQL